MADKDGSEKDEPPKDEPIIRDKRRIDPETGDVREPAAEAASEEDAAPALAGELSPEDQALLDEAGRDLVADMRNDMLRAQAELVNFRQRVERDRAANREAVIAEVLRSLLPAIDDLSRAEAHGDLVEGSPLALVAQKLRASFEKYGLKQVGVKGEPFDPSIHEAVVQLPSPDATEQTVADVIEPGYILGERLVRAAKVAVSVPAE
ncbi:MAG: nucleotide exchange factor GrpE [Rhodoglobus sp.]